MSKARKARIPGTVYERKRIRWHRPEGGKGCRHVADLGFADVSITERGYGPKGPCSLRVDVNGRMLDESSHGSVAEAKRAAEREVWELLSPVLHLRPSPVVTSDTVGVLLLVNENPAGALVFGTMEQAREVAKDWAEEMELSFSREEMDEIMDSGDDLHEGSVNIVLVPLSPIQKGNRRARAK